MTVTPFTFTPPPASLFRYQPFSEWLRPVIVASQLYFPLLHQLNDPCEYCYNIDTTWNETIAYEYLRMVRSAPTATTAVWDANAGMNIGEVFRAMQGMPAELLVDTVKKGVLGQSESQRRSMIEAQMHIDANTIGICCLAEDGRSSYMSNFYAGSHTGVCLEFSTSERPFNLAQPVTYQDQPPTMHLFGDPQSMQKARMFTKSFDWEREREWRIINHRITDGAVIHFSPVSLISIATCANFDEKNALQLRSWLTERGRLGHSELAQFRLFRRQDSYQLGREVTRL